MASWLEDFLDDESQVIAGTLGVDLPLGYGRALFERVCLLDNLAGMQGASLDEYQCASVWISIIKLDQQVSFENRFWFAKACYLHLIPGAKVPGILDVAVDNLDQRWLELAERVEAEDVTSPSSIASVAEELLRIVSS